jgi:hypothetical protein
MATQGDSGKEEEEKPIKHHIMLGIDSGTSGGGYAWFDFVSKRLVIERTSAHYDNHVLHDYTKLDHYDVKAIEWAKDPKIADVLSHTRFVCYEDMSHVKGERKLKNPHAYNGSNRNVLHYLHAQLQTIRCLYPHIVIIPIRPQDVRSWFGISGSTYDIRKPKAYDTDVLSIDETDRAKRIFKEHGTQLYDPMDALLLLIYFYHNCHAYFWQDPQPKKIFSSKYKPASERIAMETVLAKKYHRVDRFYQLTKGEEHLGMKQIEAHTKQVGLDLWPDGRPKKTNVDENGNVIEGKKKKTKKNNSSDSEKKTKTNKKKQPSLKRASSSSESSSSSASSAPHKKRMKTSS